MKILKSVSFISLLFFVVIPACMKNTVSVEYTKVSKNPVLTLSKPIVKRGEPLVVYTIAPDSGTLIKWAIRPSDSTLIVPNGDQATIYISFPGTYLITASFYSPTDTVRAYDSSNTTVTVNDSIYSVPPVGSDLDTVQLTGDQITLIAEFASDSVLSLTAKTTGLYNCSPYITAYGWGQNQGTFSLDFDFRSAEVVEGKGNCGGVKNQAIANITFLQLASGVYTVTANLNQVNYQGSLNVTDSNYTFTWNYTSGIVISPLQIKKN